MSPYTFNKVGCTQIGAFTLEKEGRLFPCRVQIPVPYLALGERLCGEAAALTQNLPSWCDHQPRGQYLVQQTVLKRITFEEQRLLDKPGDKPPPLQEHIWLFS